MTPPNQGAFARAIAHAGEEAAAKQGEALKAHLQKHGTSELHDLGGLLGLKERFYRVTGTEFDEITDAAVCGKMKTL